MLAVALSLVAPAIPLPALTLSKQLSDAAMPFEGHALPHAVPHAADDRSAALDQWGDQLVKETQDSPEAKHAAAVAAKEAEKAAAAEEEMRQDEVRRQHASHTRPMRVARFICPHASRHVPHAFSDASRRPASMGVCVSHAPLTPHASLITFDITCLSSRDVTQIAAAERGRALRNGDAHWQTGGQKCRVTLANCRDGKLNGGKKTVDQCRAPPHEPHHTRNTSAGRWRD